MIIDTSAIVAILRGEPGAELHARMIATAGIARISAATYVELGIVVDGAHDAVASGALDSFLDEAGIGVEALTESQARIARAAYQRFGRGSGHAARLNMGDCFSYALARELGEPLLFTGRDFSQTDIEIVTEPIRRRRLSEIMAGYGMSTASAGSDGADPPPAPVLRPAEPHPAHTPGDPRQAISQPPVSSSPTGANASAARS